MDLSVKQKPIKLLDDNIVENRRDLKYGDDFLDRKPKAQFMKKRIDKLYFIKI